jgi:hypothetical protein
MCHPPPAELDGNQIHGGMDASLCNLVALGSVLSDTERLGDLDIAMELLPKVTEEAELRNWCDRRQYAARE